MMTCSDQKLVVSNVYQKERASDRDKASEREPSLGGRELPSFAGKFERGQISLFKT